MDLCLRFTPPIFRSELWAGQSVTFTSPGTTTQTQICWWLLEVFFQNILIFHDSFYFDKSPRYRYTKASPQHNPPTIVFHFMLHASAFFFQTSPRPNSYSFVLCDQVTRFKYVQSFSRLSFILQSGMNVSLLLKLSFSCSGTFSPSCVGFTGLSILRSRSSCSSSRVFRHISY